MILLAIWASVPWSSQIDQQLFFFQSMLSFCPRRTLNSLKSHNHSCCANIKYWVNEISFSNKISFSENLHGFSAIKMSNCVLHQVIHLLALTLASALALSNELSISEHRKQNRRDETSNDINISGNIWCGFSIRVDSVPIVWQIGKKLIVSSKIESWWNYMWLYFYQWRWHLLFVTKFPKCSKNHQQRIQKIVFAV